MDVEAFLEGCNKVQNQYLDKFVEAYKKVFQEPNGLPSKRKLNMQFGCYVLPSRFSLGVKIPKQKL
jgi:hypothetical protein